MKVKATITFVMFAFLFFSILIRSSFLQIFNRSDLIKYSNSQVLREIKSYPRRGIIFDRNQDPLAVNIRRYNIFTIPREMKLLKSVKALKTAG